jgi:hypothetical protein
VVRCRPGIVSLTTFAKVPDQRRTASLPLALHRIRDTSYLDQAMDSRVKPAHDNSSGQNMPHRAEHPIAYNLYKHNALIYRD